MKNKNLRTFIVDGKETQFNLTYFEELFRLKCQAEKAKYGDMEQQIAEYVFVEKATVHAWRNRVNGPSDIEKVQAIAAFFKVDYRDFLMEIMGIEEKGETEMNNNTVAHVEIKPFYRNELSESERGAFRRVYLKMLDYVNLREEYAEEKYNLEWSFKMDEELWPELTDEKDFDIRKYTELTEEERYELHMHDFNEKWKNVSFRKMWKELHHSLERELLDLPMGLFVLLETLINNLEIKESLTREEFLELKDPENLNYAIYTNELKTVSEFREKIRCMALYYS